MIRVVKMGNQWYGMEIGDVLTGNDTEIENIMSFLDNAEVVVLANDQEEAESAIGWSIEMVEV